MVPSGPLSRKLKFYNWFIFDSERDSYNVVGKYLSTDTAGAEVDASEVIDFLSNGFKVRITSADINNNTDSFIGIAFAENPSKYSNAK